MNPAHTLTALIKICFNIILPVCVYVFQVITFLRLFMYCLSHAFFYLNLEIADNLVMSTIIYLLIMQFSPFSRLLLA